MIARALSASQALAIVNNCPCPLLVLGTNGQAAWYNDAFGRLLERLRLNSECACHTPLLRDNPLQALIEARDRLSWTGQGGEHYEFEVVSFPIPDDERMQVRMFVDVSQKVRFEHARDLLEDELAQQTLTDALTGLLNRRGLMLALEPQVARSRRYNRPMSLIMLATSISEPAGSLLIEVAQLLKDQLRWADLIGYTEQREFILVLPETDGEAAQRLAEKLTHSLAVFTPATADQPWALGIASWRKSDSAATLLKRAEQSLNDAHAERAACFMVL